MGEKTVMELRDIDPWEFKVRLLFVCFFLFAFFEFLNTYDE
jgi:hypothetical protein